MKTLEVIDKEINRETKGKTAVDAVAYKIATYAAYYQLAYYRVKELKEKLNHCYDVLDNNNDYMYCDKCELHYDTLDFDYKNDTPICKQCGNKIKL